MPVRRRLHSVVRATAPLVIGSLHHQPIAKGHYLGKPGHSRWADDPVSSHVEQAGRVRNRPCKIPFGQKGRLLDAEDGLVDAAQSVAFA